MPTADENKTTASYRLEDLDVKEVSVVDRGANMRKLLVIKNAEDPMPTNTDPVVAAQADKAGDTTDLIVALPEELRDELAKMLDGISVRVNALSEAVKATDPGEGGLSEKFKNELVGLGSVMKRLGGVDKSRPINELDKAALDNGAVIDRLGIPQPSAADKGVEYVMTAEGPLMKMPPGEMMKVALRYAIDEMYKAEDALYYDEDMAGACVCLFNCMKALGPFIAEGQAAPIMQAADQMKAVLTKQYAFNQPQPSIAAGVPAAHSGAAEPPAGTGKGNPGDLTKAKLEGMFEMLKHQVAGMLSVQSDAEVGTGAPTTQNVDDEIKNGEDEGTLSPAAQEALTKMAGLIKSLKAENAGLRSGRPLGNSVPDGGDSPKPTQVKVHWPDDLNDLDDPDLD